MHHRVEVACNPERERTSDWRKMESDLAYEAGLAPTLRVFFFLTPLHMNGSMESYEFFFWIPGRHMPNVQMNESMESSKPRVSDPHPNR